VAGKKDSARSKGKAPRASAPKRARARKSPIVESSGPPPADEAIAASPSAPASAQPQQQQQTTISTSRGFADFLSTNRLSLALTSYQTGQLMLIGPLLDGRLSVFQRNFVRAMGLWATPQRLYLATIAQIWRLENVLGQGQLATQQSLHYERLYVPRMSHTTGDIDAHELAVDGKNQLVFVNTKYSCLATLDTVHSFKPLWKPRFISKLAPEDRCHLNGLAMQNGAPKYVTAVSRCDVVDGWRERRHEGGILIDVESDRVVTEDLSMPHSPRLNAGTLWVLDSGRGDLCRVDAKTGKTEQVAFCPDSRAASRSGEATRWSQPRFLATVPLRGWSSRTTSRRGTASRAAAPTSSTPATATFCIGSGSRARCASCSTRPSFPASERRCAWASAIPKCAR